MLAEISPKITIELCVANKILFWKWVSVNRTYTGENRKLSLSPSRVYCYTKGWREWREGGGRFLYIASFFLYSFFKLILSTWYCMAINFVLFLCWTFEAMHVFKHSLKFKTSKRYISRELKFWNAFLFHFKHVFSWKPPTIGFIEIRYAIFCFTYHMFSVLGLWCLKLKNKNQITSLPK